MEVIHEVLDKVQGDQRDLRQESLLSLGILNAKSDKKIAREKDKKGEKEKVKREREREKIESEKGKGMGYLPSLEGLGEEGEESDDIVERLHGEELSHELRVGIAQHEYHANQPLTKREIKI